MRQPAVTMSPLGLDTTASPWPGRRPASTRGRRRRTWRRGRTGRAASRSGRRRRSRPRRSPSRRRAPRCTPDRGHAAGPGPRCRRTRPPGAAGEGEAPVGGDGQLRAAVGRARARCRARPSTVPPMVKAGVGGGAWSSSTMVTVARCRAPSAPQRACPSATVNVSAGSACASSRSGISTRRGPVSPGPKRTVVVVDLEVAARARGADARLTVTLALPCEPPLRVTSAIGARSDSFAVNRASLSARWRTRLSVGFRVSGAAQLRAAGLVRRVRCAARRRSSS